MTASVNAHPHVVRKRLAGGKERYFVYAWRGGPRVMVRDNTRPSHEEAVEVSLPVCTEASQARFLARPKSIQQIMDRCDTDRWVYFVGSRHGLVKIGAAACIKARLRTMQAHSPVRLRVLAKCRGGEELERAYHEHYSRYRKHGEWFDRCPAILAEIKRLSQPTQPNP